MSSVTAPARTFHPSDATTEAAVDEIYNFTVSVLGALDNTTRADDELIDETVRLYHLHPEIFETFTPVVQYARLDIPNTFLDMQTFTGLVEATDPGLVGVTLGGGRLWATDRLISPGLYAPGNPAVNLRLVDDEGVYVDAGNGPLVKFASETEVMQVFGVAPGPGSVAAGQAAIGGSEIWLKGGTNYDDDLNDKTEYDEIRLSGGSAYFGGVVQCAAIGGSVMAQLENDELQFFTEGKAEFASLDFYTIAQGGRTTLAINCDDLISINCTQVEVYGVAPDPLGVTSPIKMGGGQIWLNGGDGLTVSEVAEDEIRLGHGGGYFGSLVRVNTDTGNSTDIVAGAVNFYNPTGSIGGFITFDADFLQMQHTVGAVRLTPATQVIITGQAPLVAELAQIAMGGGEIWAAGNIKPKNVNYNWPAAAAAGVLTSDGSGNLSWAAGGGGISGALTSGRVPFANGSASLTDNAKMVFSATTGFNVNMATSGADNLTLGMNAGAALTNGIRNTLLGVGAGSNSTSGGRNIFIGYNSGLDTTGNNNCVIGSPNAHISRLLLGSGERDLFPNGIEITTTGGSGADNYGGSISISAGRSSGLGVGGSIGFTTTPSNLISSSSSNVPVTRFAIKYDGRISWGGILAAPSVSDANEGSIYYDSTLQKFRYSANGGAYADLVGGGGGLSGTLTSGRVPFASGTSTLTDSAGLTWDDTGSKRLTITGGTNYTEVTSEKIIISTTGGDGQIDVLTNALRLSHLTMVEIVSPDLRCTGTFSLDHATQPAMTLNRSGDSSVGYITLGVGNVMDLAVNAGGHVRVSTDTLPMTVDPNTIAFGAGGAIGTGMIKTTSTADGAITTAGKITAKAAVPASFADLAAVRTYLASILT